MDQVKQFLWQVGRYRFWISVCVAALLSAGAYVLGSGPVQKATDDEAGKISSAYKDVQQYASNTVPTADFAPIVQAKTEVLTRDVDAAWKSLYERQAPLLTWPETVSERFTKWGRKWPENVADSAVNIAIIDYIEAYPAYVDEVFKVFRPFDYETGEGVVASAPKAQLLSEVGFDVNKPPKLNEVWSAQERLWVQRTVLEVIADVNRNAKDWDSALVKEIKALEVGSAVAQDQRSLAKGEELEESEPIIAPDEPEEDEEAGGMGGMEGMMGGMMGAMGKMGGGGRAGTGAGGKIATAESVFYLKPENATQYKILPVMVTVLVDQDHVPDLLVAFENSPMSIEVRDFELQRPTDKVVKPEKGDEFMGGYGGMMGMGMMMPGMRGGRMGYGGMSSAMMARGRMMGEMGGMEGMGMMMPGMNSGMMSGMGNMGGMGAMTQRKGTDKRGVDRAEKRKEAEKALEASKPGSTFDSYYNIVEVTVYGQARFYNEPTPEAPAEEASPGEASAEAGAEEPNAEGAMPAEEPKAEAADPAEEPKADAAEAPTAEEPKAEEPKAEEPKAEEAKPAEEPQADAAEAPKAEEPKPAEQPKAEEPKPAEQPQAEAPKQP